MIQFLHKQIAKRLTDEHNNEDNQCSYQRYITLKSVVATNDCQITQSATTNNTCHCGECNHIDEC